MILNKAYLIMFLAAFFMALGLTPLILKITAKRNIVDKPSQRKVHRRPIPTLGGIAIWLGFNAGMAAAFIFIPEFKANFLPSFLGISLCTSIIVLTGIIDDIFDLNAFLKLVIQIALALILIRFGFEINIITKPTGDGVSLGILSSVITVIWIVGLINAINLLDGLDGLAAGVSGIALLFLFLAAVGMHSELVSVMALCLVGAILGFLPFNFHPAKIFMGNTGSMFLGLVLAVIALAGFQKRTTVFTLFVPLMAIAVPIIDTFLSIVRRLFKHKPIFKADKEHLHHQLLKAEKSQTQAVLSLYFLTFCYGLIALSFSSFTGIYAIIALVIVALTTYKWLKEWGFLDFD